MKNINLHKIIRKNSKLYPDKKAIITENGFLNYDDLKSSNIDLKKKKKIILYFQDLSNLIKAFVALDGQANGLCPISNQFSHEDLNYILSIYKFDMVISDMTPNNLDLFKNKNIEIKYFKDFNLKSVRVNNNNTIKTEWLIPTSGTTSKPKLVNHSLKTLISKFEKKIENEKPQVWGLFYDPTRFAGYQVLFKSLLNGHTLVSSSYLRDISHTIKICVDNKVSHISATATYWRKILMSPLAAKLPLVSIVIGGEEADQLLLNSLKLAYKDAKITHVYASTEAGTIMSVSDCLEGYPINYLDNLKTNIKIKIKKDHLYLKSKSAAKKYAGDLKLKTSDGWINTGDIVKVKKDRFFILGRKNGVVNIGGDKVFPEKVRKVILKHPMSKEVRVYGKKNPFSGMLLVADVEINSKYSKNNAKKTLLSFIERELPKSNQPKIIKIVDHIKVNSSGKINMRK
jgi:acyl-CoA synthetase (AMP-forming)/AMP-acid ligase II